MIIKFSEKITFSEDKYTFETTLPNGLNFTSTTTHLLSLKGKDREMAISSAATDFCLRLVAAIKKDPSLLDTINTRHH